MMNLMTFPQLTGKHLGAWRSKKSWTKSYMDLDKYIQIAKKAEAAKFDVVFVADISGVPMEDKAAFEFTAPWSAPITLEPVTLLSALAMVTEKIGLVATCTTTYEAPWHLARKLGSLDHISKGRAGWNIVTTVNPEDSKNFGHDEHMGKAERYERAVEFVEICKGLWDSWADDAILENKETGQYLDSTRVHVLNHKGKYLSVKGPLNMTRPPQGYPVLFSAGQSEYGRDLTAKVSDCNFVHMNTKEEGVGLMADIKGRLEKFGRSPDSLKLITGLNLYVAETRSEAQDMYDELNEGILPEIGIKALEKHLEMDLSGVNLDGPLPPVKESELTSNAIKLAIVHMAQRENLTVRQLYKRVYGYSNHVVIGTPKDSADVMEDWYRGGACDGFLLDGPYLPGGFFNICDMVVPELQRRGLFRTDYKGNTLRERMGLPTSPNQFFPS